MVSVLEASVFAQPVAPALPQPPLTEIPMVVVAKPHSGSWSGRYRLERLPRGTPRFLGGHVLIRLLGHGPRGRAFLAWHLSQGQPEVVKIIAPDRAADPIFRAQFSREAFAAAQLDHPNLVRVRELGGATGPLRATLEWVEGPSLAELIQSQGRLEPLQATVLILQAARGLSSAHAQGLWHRDVKPENLRLTADGLVKVDDLGLEMTPSLAAALDAREQAAVGGARGKWRPPVGIDGQESKPTAEVTAAVGTPAFMAPEQANDPLTSDGRADVYALGATFYTLVTGRPPFEGESAVELLRQHQEDEPIPAETLVPELPLKIADVIRTMMGKRPEERYPSMVVVIEVLEGILGINKNGASQAIDEMKPIIQQVARTLAESPARRLRARVLALSGLIWLVFTLLLLSLGLLWPGLGVLGLGLLTTVGILVSSGVSQRSRSLQLLSAVVFGSGSRAWFVGVIVVLAVLAVCLWGGSLPWFLLVCAGCLAAAFHVYLDRPWAIERKQALAKARPLVSRLRANGHDERTLHDLIVQEGGARWEELFEALFGPRSLAQARARGQAPRLGRGRGPRPTLAKQADRNRGATPSGPCRSSP